MAEVLFGDAHICAATGRLDPLLIGITSALGYVRENVLFGTAGQYRMSSE
jgi:hypothetical protein